MGRYERWSNNERLTEADFIPPRFLSFHLCKKISIRFFFIVYSIVRLYSTFNTFLYTNLFIYANFGWEFFLHVRKTVHRSAAAPIVHKTKIHTYFFNFSFLFRFGEFSHSIFQWIRNLRTLLRWQFIIYSLRACKSSQSSWTVTEAVSEVDFYLSYWKNEISSERRGKYFTLKLKLVCCHVRARFLYHSQYRTWAERREKGERWVGGKKSLYIHELFAIEMAGGFGVEAESMLRGKRNSDWKKSYLIMLRIHRESRIYFI